MIQSIRVWLYHALLEQRNMERVMAPFLIFIFFTGGIFPLIEFSNSGLRVSWGIVFITMGVIELMIFNEVLPVGWMTYLYRALAFITMPIYVIFKARHGWVFTYCDFVSCTVIPTLELMINSLEVYHKSESR